MGPAQTRAFDRSWTMEASFWATRSYKAPAKNADMWRADGPSDRVTESEFCADIGRRSTEPSMCSGHTLEGPFC